MKVWIRLIRDRDMDVVDIEVYKSKHALEEHGYDDFYSSSFVREVKKSITKEMNGVIK